MLTETDLPNRQENLSLETSHECYGLLKYLVQNILGKERKKEVMMLFFPVKSVSNLFTSDNILVKEGMRFFFCRFKQANHTVI